MTIFNKELSNKLKEQSCLPYYHTRFGQNWASRYQFRRNLGWVKDKIAFGKPFTCLYIYFSFELSMKNIQCYTVIYW